MKRSALILTLAAACHAQSTTFNPLKPLEVLSTVTGFFGSIASLLGNAADTNYIRFSTQIAFDQVGSNSNNKADPSSPKYDPTGFLPMFYVYGPTEWVAWTNGFGYLKNGENWAQTIKMDNNQRHERFMVSFNKNDFGADDLCLTHFGVRPSESTPDILPYAVLAENILLVQPSISWYYSGQTMEYGDPKDNCRKKTIPRLCAWGGRYSIKGRTSFITFNLLDVDKYARTMNNGIPFLATKDNLQVIVAPKLPKNSLDDPTDPLAQPKVPEQPFDHIITDDTHSAEDLCKSETSYGPSFVNTQEGFFCDMDTKTLYPSCDRAPRAICYTLFEDMVTISAGMSNSRTASTLNAKFRNMKTRPLSPRKTSLVKRDCVPLVGLSELPVSTKMDQNSYLHSQSGIYQMKVMADGNIKTYVSDQNPTDTWLWDLGYHGEDKKYTVEIKNNGQLCIRDGSSQLIKCANSAIAADGKWTLVLQDNGFLAIKDEKGAVKWTNDPNGPKQLVINGQVADATNSMVSNAPKYGPFTLKSKSGNTKFVYEANGRGCVVNKLGFETYCIDAPGGSGKFYFMITRQGGICSISDSGANQKCLNSGGATGDYVMLLEDTGFMRMYDMDSKSYWMRGGGHYFRLTNTLRAGEFKTQDVALVSDNGKYTIYSHSAGGIVIREKNNPTLTWMFSGGRPMGPGKYMMTLTKDARLCVTDTSKNLLDCASSGRNNDQFLLYMENNGHAYIYAPDGKSYWYS